MTRIGIGIQKKTRSREIEPHFLTRALESIPHVLVTQATDYGCVFIRLSPGCRSGNHHTTPGW